jgi:hypothetical protein
MNNNKNKQILHAYRLLFSPESNKNIEFIKSLNIKKIKSAYRAKALETHPDRAKVLGVNEKVLTTKFNEITDAYKDLYEFIKQNSVTVSLKNRHTGEQFHGNDNKNRTGYRYTGKPRKNARGEEKKRTDPGQKERGKAHDHQWKRKNYRLLFGQYLFFSGYITFSALLDAIFWQRKQRDLYGKIALKWGIIQKDDILVILKGRKPLEKFGDCALRLGYIKEFQHQAILFKQSKMQKHLGEYFVNSGMITREQLQRILLEYKKYQLKN